MPSTELYSGRTDLTLGQCWLTANVTSSTHNTAHIKHGLTLTGNTSMDSLQSTTLELAVKLVTNSLYCNKNLA